MYSNNILNFQESATILNACTKKSGNLLNAPGTFSLNTSWTSNLFYWELKFLYIYIYIYIYIYFFFFFFFFSNFVFVCFFLSWQIELYSGYFLNKLRILIKMFHSLFISVFQNPTSMLILFSKVNFSFIIHFRLGKYSFSVSTFWKHFL